MTVYGMPLSSTTSSEPSRVPNSCVAGVGADDRDAPRLLVVGEREAAAVLDVDGADGLVLRLDAVDRQRGGVEAALDAQSAALISALTTATSGTRARAPGRRRP